MGAQRRQRGEVVVGGRGGGRVRKHEEGQKERRWVVLPLKEEGSRGGWGWLYCLQRQRAPLLFFFSFLVHDPPHTTTATHTHTFIQIYIHTPPKFLVSPFQPPHPFLLAPGWVDFEQCGCHIPAQRGGGGGHFEI